MNSVHDAEPVAVRHRRRAFGIAGVVLLSTAAVLPLALRSLASTERDRAIEPAPVPPPSRVAGLGYIEPRDGVIRVAGPARAAVVQDLLVEEGQWVEAGQALAVLETHAASAAKVARARAIVDSAEADLARLEHLVRQGAEAMAVRDDARRALAVARADLKVALASLELATVRAPRRGQVLEVHARAGERIGPEGILELGETDAMYAVAEVYETDVGRVRPGLRAVVHSPVFARRLGGVIERVGMTVRRQRMLDEDPTAQVDARVVEVHVRLDAGDGPVVAGLSNLRVDVVIDQERR